VVFIWGMFLLNKDFVEHQDSERSPPVSAWTWGKEFITAGVADINEDINSEAGRELGDCYDIRNERGNRKSPSRNSAYLRWTGTSTPE